MGNAEKDVEMVTVWHPTRGKLRGWVAGRGHLPGEKPSLEPAGDGRSGTYHERSQLMPAHLFGEHLDAADGTDPETWAREAPEEVRAWLLALPPDELLVAHGQAKALR